MAEACVNTLGPAQEVSAPMQAQNNDWPKCECGCGEPAPAAKYTDKRRGLVKGEPARFLPGHSAYKRFRTQKRCTRCGEVKPIAEFRRRTKQWNSQCRPCEVLYRREVYYKDVEKTREQKRAHTAVHRAIRRGRLSRAECCEECRVERETDAHHDDYSKPLDVRWLCDECHQKLHAAPFRPNPEEGE